MEYGKRGKTYIGEYPKIARARPWKFCTRAARNAGPVDE